MIALRNLEVSKSHPVLEFSKDSPSSQNDLFPHLSLVNFPFIEETDACGGDFATWTFGDIDLRDVRQSQDN